MATSAAVKPPTAGGIGSPGSGASGGGGGNAASAREGDGTPASSGSVTNGSNGAPSAKENSSGNNGPNTTNTEMTRSLLNAYILDYLIKCKYEDAAFAFADEAAVKTMTEAAAPRSTQSPKPKTEELPDVDMEILAGDKPQTLGASIPESSATDKNKQPDEMKDKEGPEAPTADPTHKSPHNSPTSDSSALAASAAPSSPARKPSTTTTSTTAKRATALSEVRPLIPIDTPDGFLLEWWSVFWDVFSVRSNRTGSVSASTYVDHANRVKGEYQRNLSQLTEQATNSQLASQVAQNQAMAHGIPVLNAAANGYGSSMVRPGVGGTGGGNSGEMLNYANGFSDTGANPAEVALNVGVPMNERTRQVLMRQAMMNNSKRGVFAPTAAQIQQLKAQQLYQAQQQGQQAARMGPQGQYSQPQPARQQSPQQQQQQQQQQQPQQQRAQPRPPQQVQMGHLQGMQMQGPPGQMPQQGQALMGQQQQQQHGGPVPGQAPHPGHHGREEGHDDARSPAMANQAVASPSSKRQRLSPDGAYAQLSQQQGRPPTGPAGNMPNANIKLQQAHQLLQQAGINPNSLSTQQMAAFQHSNPAAQQQQLQALSMANQQQHQQQQQQQRAAAMAKGQPGQEQNFFNELYPNMPQQQVRGPGNNGNHALQDYQMQLMLLEQQNKKRLMIARQEQERLHMNSSDPNNSTFHIMSPQAANSSNASPQPPGAVARGGNGGSNGSGDNAAAASAAAAAAAAAKMPAGPGFPSNQMVPDPQKQMMIYEHLKNNGGNMAIPPRQGMVGANNQMQMMMNLNGQAMDTAGMARPQRPNMFWSQQHAQQQQMLQQMAQKQAQQRGLGVNVPGQQPAPPQMHNQTAGGPHGNAMQTMPPPAPLQQMPQGQPGQQAQPPTPTGGSAKGGGAKKKEPKEPKKVRELEGKLNSYIQRNRRNNQNNAAPATPTASEPPTPTTPITPQPHMHGQEGQPMGMPHLANQHVPVAHPAAARNAGGMPAPQGERQGANDSYMQLGPQYGGEVEGEANFSLEFGNGTDDSLGMGDFDFERFLNDTSDNNGINFNFFGSGDGNRGIETNGLE